MAKVTLSPFEWIRVVEESITPLSLLVNWFFSFLAPLIYAYCNCECYPIFHCGLYYSLDVTMILYRSHIYPTWGLDTSRSREIWRFLPEHPGFMSLNYITKTEISPTHQTDFLGFISRPLFLIVAVHIAWTLLSWSRIVSETCPTRVRTHVSYVLLSIYHVSTCCNHFNVAVYVQHRLPSPWIVDDQWQVYSRSKICQFFN